MKKRYKFIIVFFVGLLFSVVWFLWRVKTEEPKIDNITYYDKLKLSINTDTLKVCGNNWLKKNQYGLYELYIEGDDYERGYINGLLTKDLIEKQEIAFKEQIDALIPSGFYQSFLKYMIAWFNRDLDTHVSEPYQKEIFGISKSFSTKYNYLGPAYDRILNYHAAHDIGHMMQNMNFVGCTSFGLWGNSTHDSSLYLGRNFDFYVGDKFAEDKIVAFVNPKEGHKFMMVTWGGMVGVTSGMNYNGLTVTLNSSKSEIPSGSATPVSIIARDILQHASTIQEAFEIAQKYQSFVSESFMIGSAKDHETAIIEKSTIKTVLYRTKKGSTILCTNHFQSDSFVNDPINIESRDAGASKYRFERLNELLSDSIKFDSKKIAQVLRNTKGKNNIDIGLGNECAVNQLIAHHSVIFKPGQKIVWVSSNPYQLGEYVAYDLNKIFNDSSQKIYKQNVFSPDYTIDKDTLLKTKEYANAIEQRRLIKLISKRGYDVDMSKVELSILEHYNTDYYEGHMVLGKYYAERKDNDRAIKSLEIALNKQINKLSIRQEIEAMIKQLKAEK